MKPFDDLLARACRDPRRIVLAEGQDPRVLEGAVRAAREGVAEMTLLGREATIRDLLGTRGMALRRSRSSTRKPRPSASGWPRRSTNSGGTRVSISPRPGSLRRVPSTTRP